MTKLSARLAVALFASAQMAPAIAADEAPDIATRLESYSISYVVNPDASFVEERAGAIKVLKQSAVENAKQFSISYSTSIQTAEVLEAYTRKPDGRHVDVPKDNYQVSANSGRGENAPVFSDLTTMTWVFPDVAMGDTLVFSYRLVAKEPMFEGHFSISETFSRGSASDKVRIRIDSPASLWAQFEARELREVRNEVSDGRRLLEWTFENPKPVKSKRKDYSVYDPQQAPGYAFSTFRDYAAITEAYGKVSRAKAKPTPRVRKLADEIVGKEKQPREVARLLYEWVALNVNYAGNCIGLGAVVPRDIDFVLDNRIGDCKDHATLLQALLSAKGIDSTQALINAGSAYTLPKIPVVSMVNHVINYIPSLDVYVDSTSSSTPFGMLPSSSFGKPVLLVDGYRDGTRAPVPPIGRNLQKQRSEITVRPDGSIEADVEVSLRGHYAVDVRSMFRDMPEDRKPDMIKEYLGSNGQVGSGKIDLDDAKALIDTYRYGAHMEIQDVLTAGAGAFAISPVLFSVFPVAGYAMHASIEVEKQAIACSSGRSSEEYVYHFPKGMQILSVPDAMKVSNDFLSYEASYELSENKLVVKRDFDDRTPGNICSPELMQQYKTFAKPVFANLRSQVLYKLPAAEGE